MSVKIYNGMRTDKITTMPALTATINAVRSKVLEAARNRLLMFVKGDGESIINVDEWKRRRASTLFSMALDHKPHGEAEMSVTAYPMRGYILYHTFSSGFFDTGKAEKVFDDAIGGYEFGYWDNTDRPDDMTAAGWLKRKRVWEAVLLNGTGIPAVEGWSMKLYNCFMLATALQEVDHNEFKRLVNEGIV